VLDPFSGTGTTGEVAIKLGRRFVGIDLYQENVNRTADKCRKAFADLLAQTPVENTNN
jgi:DNA modification methylase